jgi:cardiolipin synthase
MMIGKRTVESGHADRLAALSGHIQASPIARYLQHRTARSRAFPYHMPAPVQIGATEVQIYPEGHGLADVMLAAIEQARQTILFETFLWSNDAYGQRFKQVLISRAQAGIQVYIIYDRLANLPYASAAFKHFPDLPTLHVLPYRSLRHLSDSLDPRRLGRDHRKLLIVDGQIGFVRGYNISIRWLGWRDTHMRVRGPAAADLAAAFTTFWNRERGDQSAIEPPGRRWNPLIRVYCNDVVQLAFPIRALYLDAIERAQQRLWITTAYFVPDPILLHALQRAAARGVDVRILFPWKSEHATADWLSRRCFGRCLRSGVRLFGYRSPILHAKTATSDGDWTLVGTANLDRMSLAGNNEINVELFDPALAREMEAMFLCDLTNADEILLAQWARRPWYQRLGEALIAPFWPLA